MTTKLIILSVAGFLLGFAGNWLRLRRRRINAAHREFQRLYNQADAKTRAVVDEIGFPTFSADRTATKSPADLIAIARTHAKRVRRASRHHRGGR